MKLLLVLCFAVTFALVIARPLDCGTGPTEAPTGHHSGSGEKSESDEKSAHVNEPHHTSTTPAPAPESGCTTPAPASESGEESSHESSESLGSGSSSKESIPESEPRDSASSEGLGSGHSSKESASVPEPTKCGEPLSKCSCEEKLI